MTISREVRIGLLVAITLVTLFFGFYFLKGANIFSGDKEFYCFYPNVDGLQNSANVQVSGLNVGHVIKTKLEGAKGVRVVISIDKSVEVPEGTTANLASSDLLGTKIIKLVPGPGPGMVTVGGELKSVAEGSVVDNVSAQLTPRLAELKTTIVSLDTVLAGVGRIVGAQNQEEMAAAIRNINTMSANLVKISATLNAETGQVSGVINNANSITGNLAKQNDTINRIMGNVSALTRQLSNAPIQKTLADLEQTAAQLQGIMDKINSNKGSLGMLINDKEVYNNLNGTLKSVTALTDDLKAHPKRYINLSVFGGKDKEGGKK